MRWSARVWSTCASPRSCALRAGALDVGVDLYNLFNSNVTTAYQQTYEQVTNGAAWLRPTAIAAPRLARLHVTLNF